MADDTAKVYHNETIVDTPIPTEGPATAEATSGKSGGEEIVRNTTIREKDFPERKVAYEVLSSALNTKSKKILAEFEFTPSGALQIGKYEPGVSGDVRISPNGITARNDNGDTTFSLDGSTGSAVFAGEIRTGTLVSGLVVVGNNNVIIDGEARRILIYDENGTPRILLGYHENGF
jgi:hypothetical protein